MKNSFFLKQSAEETLTEIFLKPHLLKEPLFFEKIKKLGSRFVLITDSIVEKLHAIEVLTEFEKHNLTTSLIVIAQGENHKTRETKAHIEDQLFALKMGRDTVLIALGGGVVSDITGFVASTYCRGIPYVILPSTLLSMVDACIGGKTAVNAGPYKNMIGSFYPPKMIGIDLQFLTTLPENQWRNGLAEIIKYGLISSCKIIDLLREKFSLWQQKDLSLATELILQSIEIKCRIVEEDPKEKGLRRILNFGHTIGHGIESLENYTIGHGDAVAIGMYMESFLSMKLAYLSTEDVEKLEELLLKCGFSLNLSSNITLESLKAVMMLDKKSVSQSPRFVLLEKIGKAHPFNGEYCTSVSDDILQETFDWMKKR